MDGAKRVFEVYDVVSAPKTAFPTDRVYGDTPTPELRLITCGGEFDDDTGADYETYDEVAKDRAARSSGAVA